MKAAMLRRGALAFAAATAVFTLTGAGTSSAETAEIYCDPHDSGTCVYEGDTLKGWGSAVQPGSCRNWGFSYNRMVNYTGYYQRMWTRTGCTGTSILVRPGEDYRAGTGHVSQGGY